MLEHVIMRVRAPVSDDRDWRKVSQNLLDACSRDEQLYLDVLDACLHFMPKWDASNADSLRGLLAQGGSVWTVSSDNRSLQRAVDPQVQAAFELATSPADSASTELAEAWSRAYGRHPNASDVWDHSIKAVEAILIPIVVPAQTKPTLGHVVSHLATQGNLWKLSLPGPNDDYDVVPLVGMLGLIWPNPDRHGSPQHRRTPTLEEARAVVQLAVTIVQWGRDGQIVKR